MILHVNIQNSFDASTFQRFTPIANVILDCTEIFYSEQSEKNYEKEKKKKNVKKEKVDHDIDDLIHYASKPNPLRLKIFITVLEMSSLVQ